NNQRIVVDYDTPPQRFEYSGGTTTLGIVVKPTDWLSFLYNDSDNQGLPDVNRIVLPDSTFADPSEGEGKDYGLMLNLLEGRMFIRAAKFESSMIGLTAFGNRGNVETPNNRILETLLNAGLITQAESDAREVVTNCYTFGRDSEGYEFELTGNITDNWSIRLNYSETDRVQYNIMPEVLAWYPEQDAWWKTFGDDVYYNRDDEGVDEAGPYEPPSGFDSIYLESDRIKRYLDNTTAFEGVGDQGSRSKSANVFTSYRFTDGPLRGFNFGAGVRYNGPLSVAVDLANESIIWGNSTTIYDFMAGYRTKLNDKMDIRFQLNIRNLFDEDEYTIAGLQLDGRLDRIALQTPREFQFRTTLSW
ncbi:MAG: TonB-dependent receptor, partial [Verrucomicrobiae bacterium]|nr:TonB-dependent receptor [Verrucomicrobiae bacterium]